MTFRGEVINFSGFTQCRQGKRYYQAAREVMSSTRSDSVASWVTCMTQREIVRLSVI